MRTSIETKGINVVLLCGGRGKRLQSVVSDRPKPTAEINGRLFLDILIDYVANFGFRHFILCIGYMGNFIKRYYQRRKDSLEILFSKEKEPLGTAGAIKNAKFLISSSLFLVMNGDSFCQVDLRKFVNFHLGKDALISIVLTKTKDYKDYGTVILGDSRRIVGFNEKPGGNKNSFVSTGIYLFQQETLSLMEKQQRFSLEEDFFPKIVTNQDIYGYITQKPFIDIGIPERYKNAKKLLSV